MPGRAGESAHVQHHHRLLLAEDLINGLADLGRAFRVSDDLAEKALQVRVRVVARDGFIIVGHQV